MAETPWLTDAAQAAQRYEEAAAVAVEACADDTKGQKCYICLEAVHSRTGEGLVRGCGCGDRDGVSYAHPTVHAIKRSLDESRAALRVRSLLGLLALAFMVAVFALVWWRGNF